MTVTNKKFRRNSMKKKIVCLTLASIMLMPGLLTGCASTLADTPAKAHAAASAEGKTPKYVFLFIGDGMSYPQVQLTNYFKSANSSSENAEKITVEGEEKTVLSSQNNL